MHSVMTLLSFLALGFNPCFCVLLMLAAAFVGTCSGMLAPMLEGVALAGAITAMPGMLAKATPGIQAVGMLLLLCWTISCMVMIGRFCCTPNQWISWHGPSFAQLFWDFRRKPRQQN